MKVLLLPGLDGTGTLFSGLSKALPKQWTTETICLSKLPGDSYLTQAQSIAKSFLNEKTHIIAESYSGRIAYELSLLAPEKILSITFIASFISSPSLLSKAAQLAPISLIDCPSLTKITLNFFGFNGKGSDILIDSTYNALLNTNRGKLKQRLHNIASISQPSQRLEIPAVYIRPDRDRLVSKKAVIDISAIYINLNVIDIPGGHFIAQAHPNKVARIIMNFAEGLLLP
ncbi:alpha/beta fold hydrolase [Microbulbifer sp. EKSA008]|uniref:alpha/beta fold hydrolase n=1 Tax=unclassified Microbulbifer TaxID=2619833 RepID=UPI004039E158